MATFRSEPYLESAQSQKSWPEYNWILIQADNANLSILG